MSNLAYVIRSCGQQDTAIDLMAQCVGLCEQILGIYHPDTSDTRSKLKEWIEIRDKNSEEFHVTTEASTSCKDQELEALSELEAVQWTDFPQE